MGRNTRTVNDLEKEMEEIDEAIVTHSKIIDDLKYQRYELLAQKQDWEMQDVFECAFESGFTPDEMMHMLVAAIKEKLVCTEA